MDVQPIERNAAERTAGNLALTDVLYVVHRHCGHSLRQYGLGPRHGRRARFPGPIGGAERPRAGLRPAAIRARLGLADMRLRRREAMDGSRKNAAFVDFRRPAVEAATEHMFQNLRAVLYSPRGDSGSIACAERASGAQGFRQGVPESSGMLGPDGPERHHLQLLSADAIARSVLRGRSRNRTDDDRDRHDAGRIARHDGGDPDR